MPMTVPAAAATCPPLAQGQPASREPELLQASDVTAEQPAWAAPTQQAFNFDITSEEANASLSLLDLRLAIPLTDLCSELCLLVSFHSKGTIGLFPCIKIDSI